MVNMLTPQNYHIALRDYLKVNHQHVWDWFSSIEAQKSYLQEVELHLLKTTYRMNREGHQNLYSIVDDVLEILEIDVPITLYQAQGSNVHSAALYFTPDHGHVILQGGIIELLNDQEMKALFAHELAHFKLWVEQKGEFLISDQILTAMANEPRASDSHRQSARLYQLYTEIYADKGSCIVTDEKTAISTLIKVHTGLKEVDTESYIQQAADIFTKETVKTSGISHPELFIRVQAIRDYSNQIDRAEYEAKIQSLIEGVYELDELDILAQEKMAENTKQLILYHLKDKWLRTNAMMAHVGLFFQDLTFDSNQSLEMDLSHSDQSIQDYFAFLLIDFASVDADLEENGIAASFLTADKIGISNQFEKLIRKELKILKKDATRIRKDATNMVKKAATESKLTTEGGVHG